MLLPREGHGAAVGSDGQIYALGGLAVVFDPFAQEYVLEVTNSSEGFTP